VRHKLSLQVTHCCRCDTKVPRQIAADREQILSLRDDDRQTTDLERFYVPLTQVFEHSRLLLAAFGVQYMRRAGHVDVPWDELVIQPDAPVLCGGLTSTVTAARWTRHDSTVALKALTRTVDCNNVEDYLLEEEAYRYFTIVIMRPPIGGRI